MKVLSVSCKTLKAPTYLHTVGMTTFLSLSVKCPTGIDGSTQNMLVHTQLGQIFQLVVSPERPVGSK